MAPESVSIVVPTYNQSSQLERLLDSIDRMTSTPPTEVVVVDDGSCDDTPSILDKWVKTEHKYEPISIRNKQNKGPATARNLGIQRASSDLIAFTDSDCVVSPNWVIEVRKRIDTEAMIIGTGGHVLPLDDKNIISRYNTFHRVLEPPDSMLYLVTANCCYHRQTILDIGGFDENLTKPGGEDVSLSIKLWKDGWRFKYNPEAIIYHDYKPTIRSFFRTFHNYGRGCGYISRKYFQQGGTNSK